MLCLDIGPGTPGRVKISDIAALPVQTGAAHSPPVGCSTQQGCWRTARSSELPPPVKGLAVDRLLLAARLAAAGVDLSGRLLAEFFLVDFVPLLSRADDVVLMAMNMCPFLPNCVDVTRWRRHRFLAG